MPLQLTVADAELILLAFTPRRVLDSVRLRLAAGRLLADLQMSPAEERAVDIEQEDPERWDCCN